ncbi:MAG: hypothetical protein J5835_04300 [Bacteroidales bacterium]|nr:hypothetical protein [Bacteroidales bacterium]
MKRRLIYLLPLLLAAVSCKEEGLESGFSDTVIQLSGGQIGSKGFLEANGLNVVGTREKVYDVITGFNGRVNGVEYTSSDSFVYINDVVRYDGGTYWPYANAETEYRWTRTGVHRFFGHLDFDKSYNNNAGLSTSDFFGSNPTLDSDPSSPTFLTLTTPTYSFQSGSPQYDFVYSKKAVVRNASDKNYNTVDLPQKHLFTAISLSLVNHSTETSLEITDINTLYNGNDMFLHKGYATIDYSSNADEITPVYTLQGDNSHPFFNATAMSGKTIDPGDKYDLLTGTDITSSGTAQYFMTWPVTAAQISPQTITGVDEFGDPIYAESDAILVLRYKANGSQNVETARVAFPRRDWKAGTKVQLIIDFTDKSIQMNAEVLPWDFNEHEMNFRDESVVVPDGGKLSIVGQASLPDNATIHLTTHNPEVTCKVFISSLNGATLVINKVGSSPSYFTIEPSTITIHPQILSFVVKPSSLSTGGIARSIQLSFSIVLPDGREIDADSELLGNDHNYTFSRQ